MAVRIRLRRMGTNKVPCYRIVVADARSPRDGRFIEEIGTYRPRQGTAKFEVNLERARYWLQRGAQPSETVRELLKKAEKAAQAQQQPTSTS
ncbi:MAG: 30S ribosomal protein S16 [Verrucomicrobiae bacterium]|nr:30S ribosomal protein S16 [Verrucomicrobiae bacterium]